MTTRDNLRTAIYLCDIGDHTLLLQHRVNCRLWGDMGAWNMCEAILGRWEEIRKMRE